MEVKRQIKPFLKLSKCIVLLCILITALFSNTKCLSQTFIQNDSLHIYLTQQDSSLIDIWFENNSNKEILLNTCFDFQTNGELGSPDITFEILSDTVSIFPVANFYTKRQQNCYESIPSNGSYSCSIDINFLFKKVSFFNNETFKVRAYIYFNYLKDNKLKKEYFVTNFILFKNP